MSTMTTLLLIVPLMHIDAMAFKHLLYIRLSCSIIHNFLSIYLSFLLFARLPLFVCLFFCNIWTVQKKMLLSLQTYWSQLYRGAQNPTKWFSSVANKLFEWVWQFCGIGVWRVEGFHTTLTLRTLTLKP